MLEESHANPCPKCGFGNKPDAIECQHCGIIFKKYEMIQRRKLEENKHEEQTKQTPPHHIKNTNKISETVYIIIALALAGIGLVAIVAIALNGANTDLPLWAGVIFVAVSIPITVYKRHFKKIEKSHDIEETESIGPRVIGTPLAIGIVFFPVIFSWFTLAKGYSIKTRVTTFTWLVMSTLLLSTYHTENLNSSSYNQTPNYRKQAWNSSLTGPQNNAVRSAKNYLSFKGFSRSGLINQLSSDAGDGYNVADATAAVDSLNIDWNIQAVRAAKNYLSFQGFSCKGLIEQLSSSAGDGFTESQATYGARQTGACQ